MAANEEKKIADQLFEEMKSLAVEQEQCFYELLSDWTEYKFNIDPKKNQHKYLKQNIGYALFGPPTKNEEEINTTENSVQFCYTITEKPNDTEANTADAVDYDPKAKKAIEKIYKKIHDCIDMEADPFQSIYFGVIYNIRKSIQETIDNAEKPSTSTNDVNKIWYIDTNARVYKNWSDYTISNKLPELVLPKDGSYQPNPDYPITEDYSTVWIEIMDSPACALATKVYDNIDLVSNIIGTAVLGLSAAALFTPLAVISNAPVVGAATASGFWTAFRNSQESINRRSHGEFILDREEFPYWLGLTGSAAGLGAAGGSVIISRVAANGATILTVVKVAFNTVQSDNPISTGIGVAYMSYSMIEKYKEEQTWDYLDALNLATHIMFFASSVINVKFANDIIKDSH